MAGLAACGVALAQASSNAAPRKKGNESEQPAAAVARKDKAPRADSAKGKVVKWSAFQEALEYYEQLLWEKAGAEVIIREFERDLRSVKRRPNNGQPLRTFFRGNARDLTSKKHLAVTGHKAIALKLEKQIQSIVEHTSEYRKSLANRQENLQHLLQDANLEKAKKKLLLAQARKTKGYEKALEQLQANPAKAEEALNKVLRNPVPPVETDGYPDETNQMLRYQKRNLWLTIQDLERERESLIRRYREVDEALNRLYDYDDARKGRRASVGGGPASRDGSRRLPHQVPFPLLRPDSLASPEANPESDSP